MPFLRSRRPSWPTAAEEVRVRTVDGVLLAGIHLPRPALDLVFVVIHGMTNSTHAPGTRAAMTALSRHGGVLGIDLRGHGRSAGRSSVGRDEILDVDAAVGLARTIGYRRVVTVGFSLGGAMVLRQAGTRDQPDTLRHAPDAVVSVSAPARWYIRTSPSMRRVHWLLEHPLGRPAGRAIGIRLGHPWTVIPPTPLQAVTTVAPTPLLLVHGLADHYFSPQQAVDLHRAAPGSELWLEPGMGHAESGTTDDLIDRVAAWTLGASTGSGPTGTSTVGSPTSL